MVVKPTHLFFPSTDTTGQGQSSRVPCSTSMCVCQSGLKEPSGRQRAPGPIQEKWDRLQNLFGGGLVSQQICMVPFGGMVWCVFIDMPGVLGYDGRLPSAGCEHPVSLWRSIQNVWCLRSVLACVVRRDRTRLTILVPKTVWSH